MMRKLNIIYISIILVLFFFGYLNFRQDDAYIFYTYAKNIAEGNGYVFNLGEKINATTSPLYTILLAFIYFLVKFISTESFPAISNLISVLSILGIIYSVNKIVKDIKMSILFPLIFLANPLLKYGVGMETFLNLALICYSIYLFTENKMLFASFFMALSVFARLDSILFAGIIFTYYVVKNKKLPPIKSIIIFIVTFLPWFIFSKIYFDSFLPTTIAVKLSQKIFQMHGTGLIFLRGFFNAIPGTLISASLLIIGSIVSALYLIRKKSVLLRNEGVLLIFICFGILFFVLILLTISSVSYLIILPLLKYFNVFRNRDFFYSANKVGKYFPEIKDDLINALQLVSSNKSNNIYSVSLLDAAFKNVYERAKPIKFESIVNFTKVKELSMYFISIFVFCVLLFVFIPGLQAASNRLINFNQEFIPPAKFYFEVFPGNAEVTKGENVDFVIRIKGEVPKKVFLLTREESQTNFEEHELQKDSLDNYKFSIQQLRSSLNYYASAEDIQSEKYQIKVIDRPVIRSLDVKVISPGYSNIPILEQKDNGNVSALVGSNIEINLLSNKELKSARIEFEDSTKTDLSIQNNLVKGSFKIRKDNSYIIVINDLAGNNNLQPVRYYIKALYDSNPAIELVYPKENINLANDNRVPIEVKINDDYGFSKLNLNYRLSSSKYEPVQEKFNTMDIAVNIKIKEQLVDYIWNLTKINPAVMDFE